VTGGIGTLSAEVLFINGSSFCSLPEMSQSKFGHTQSGLTACGGFKSESRTSCIQLSAGSWTTQTEDLLFSRYYLSSWTKTEGDILLIGGDGSSSTTEILYENGTSVRAFDLKYNTRFACSIELPELFIVTGGYDTMTKVSKYSSSGWIEDIPELNEGRRDHGCGYFYNDNMERVFLVAGGYDGVLDISSTETLIEGGQAWNFQQSLPSENGAPKGISLFNTVIMTGGINCDVFGCNYLDDVLMFDPKSLNWLKVGRMKNGRYYHGASLVNIYDVINYCN